MDKNIINPFINQYDRNVPSFCSLIDTPSDCLKCKYSNKYSHYHHEIGLKCTLDGKPCEEDE